MGIIRNGYQSKMETILKKLLQVACLLAIAAAAPATAQFTGPGASGAEVSAAQATAARPGTYVTLVGNIVSHLREDYYTFRDASGEIRVEVAANVFQNRAVSPETQVRLLGEVDTGRSGPYVWVKALDIVP
jgi:uncharacterized protein (TIGR00156 family)